jgi:glycosyltransferase involved in cell wall biosynthesis
MRTYLESLLIEFTKLAPHHQYVLTTPDWADSLVDNVNGMVQVVRLPHVPRNRAKRIAYQQTILPRALKKQDLDVFLATATIAPLLCPAPVVLTVQFIQFYKWPDAYGRFRTSYLRKFLPASLRKAQKAIIFSEGAKRDLIEWTGVTADKVAVVPHGLPYQFARLVDDPSALASVAPETELTGGRPYIAYVSATYGYKNQLRLIEAFGRMKRRTSLPHVLLLVGSAISVSYEQLRAAARHSGIAEDVIVAGRIDPAERLVAIYKGADLAIIPTLYETFGFPALEAMACDCPVVTSRIESMADLCDDAAVFVDPLDINSIADGIQKVLTDERLRASLIVAARKRARAYTWRKTAAETLQILEAVGGAS